MVGRFRIFATASGLALIGALATAVGQAAADESPPGNGVTFTSQAAAVRLVTHLTHSPTQEGREAASTSKEDLRVPLLSPKGPRASGEGARQVSSSGETSDNNNSDSKREGGTPSPSASFIGMAASATICNYFGPGCNPPDMAVAASSKWVFQGVNTSFEVLDTAGHVQPGWPVNAQQFFNVPNDTNANGTPCDTAHGSQAFMSDPRAFYDPIDKRFWAAELQAAGVPALDIAGDCPLKSYMWVAVSQTSNPNGKWHVYAFDTKLDPGFFNDFTQIGFDRQAIYVSANMFQITKGVITGFYAELFEANKSQMERGKANFTPDAFFNLQATGPGAPANNPFLADTVQPAQNLDTSAGSGETFIDTLDGPDPVTGNGCSSAADACSGLALWKMKNPIAHDTGGPAPTFTGQYVATKPFDFSPAATQPSCNQCVDANAQDLRISGSTVIRNGIDYGAWETGINNGTQVVPGIEWAQINLSKLGTDEAARTGYYNFSGDAAASYPALMPDGQDNVMMVFDHMSSTVFPETRYIVKSEDGNFHGAGVLLKAGENSYRPQLCGTLQSDGSHFLCRWGDYEATSWDGGNHIWFASQYANTLQLGPPQNGRNWGTWIGAIKIS